MSHMPKWMSELIEKGSSVTECLEMWRQEQEAMRAERDQARAERETVRAEKEAERELEKVRLAHEREERQAKRDRDKWEAEKEIKLRELALKEKELEKSKTGPSPQSIHTPSVKLPKFEEGQDPDVFLKSFEKIAGLQSFSKIF
ncbi:DDRGK domain-containing protein 1-like [Saccostrea cucullata]|uniref:DDRGK domain-containing protein 1-like n=1 Tax=Saccostrea cuccullata TaxID=36930 RepID=UPI002ED4DEB0